MAKLHKMVNGKKVDLSDEEEASLKAEWEKSRLEHNERRLRLKAERELKLELKGKLAKLLDVPLEEIDLLMGKTDELLGG